VSEGIVPQGVAKGIVSREERILYSLKEKDPLFSGGGGTTSSRGEKGVWYASRNRMKYDRALTLALRKNP